MRIAGWRFGVLVVGVFSGLAAFSAVSIENAGDLQSVALPDYADMSGISWCGSNATFYVVRDGGATVSNGCFVHIMSPALSPRGMMNATPSMSKGILLQGAHDAEGIARDPLSGTIWVSDEYDTSIREYDPVTGRQTGNDVEIPSFIVKNTRGNLSLESLTISPDGRTMWTANEEALKTDGNAANPTNGTTVRIIRFSRRDAFDPWTLSGMWAYQCEPVGATLPVNSGVSDLCALPDGSLLVLKGGAVVGALGGAVKDGDGWKVSGMLDWRNLTGKITLDLALATGTPAKPTTWPMPWLPPYWPNWKATGRT